MALINFSTAIVADAFCKEHLTGSGHPECAARFDAALHGLTADGLFDSLVKLDSRSATMDELLLCHEPAYLSAVKNAVQEGATELDADTHLSPKTWDVAIGAVGGVLNAVDAVVAGKVQNAFCIVRPPGHHASAARAMGFCILNNIAIATRYIQRRHGFKKIAIIDWDVHHGNGTQDIFYDDGSAFFFSTHQWPWFPGTGSREERGKDAGLGTTLNYPLPPGAGMKEIGGAFTAGLIPALAEFQPDFVLISAGFDSRKGDPLGYFTLSDVDFAELTRMTMEIAATHCEGRLVSVLEGGYSLPGLASAVNSHVRALAEG